MGKNNKKEKKRKIIESNGNFIASSKSKSNLAHKNEREARIDNGENKNKKQRIQGKPEKSLASKLKTLRGTAESTPFPPEWTGDGDKQCTSLSPEDGDDFHECLNTSYKGFCWETPEKLPSSLHASFSSVFSKLDAANIFQYDTVQPGRKRLSRTFVTRTLIGNPGSTYRYLGLRLFSHPWCDVDENGDSLHKNHNGERKESTPTLTPKKKKQKKSNDTSSLVSLGYDQSTAQALLMMGNINSFLAERSKKILENEIAESVPEKLVGSADFSLTLINKMEPSSLKKDLKGENIYGMGKTSVSWHMDSGLQDFSTIAVYHELKDIHPLSSKDSKLEDPWRVALRISGEGKKTPPLSVPLPSGTLYYMLDDFNHKHEHAVLSGSDKLRYSSTHRVAREGRGTWQYIRDKCNDVLSDSSSNLIKSKAKAINTGTRNALVKEVRKQQQLFTEIEFEWIRQWLVQGQIHADLHPYWHVPMEKLKTHYLRLEVLSVEVLNLLQQSTYTMDPSDSIVCENLFDVMIEALNERIQLRDEWKKRLNDPIFNSMDRLMKPIECNIIDRIEITDHKRQMSSDLVQIVNDLRSWRMKFVHLKDKSQKRSVKNSVNSKPSSLTRKEQKKVASNWQKMKSSMGRK